jgi:L-malate glycosyltransferase
VTGGAPRRALPDLCVASSMLGLHDAYPMGQPEILAELLRAEGASVLATSAEIGKVRRAVDTAWSLVRWRRQFDVGVVSVFSGPNFSYALLATALMRAWRKPVVLHLHGGNLPEFAARRPRAYRWLAGRATAIVAPSRYLVERLPEAGPTAQVIPNIIELGDYDQRRRERADPRILWMRTFHELYQPLLAVEVFDRIRRERPGATMTMAGGDKGELAAVRADVAARGLDDVIALPGLLDAAGKRAAFAEHDVFLNTNRIDNVPVSVIEACASGLVVVATAVGGLPYLVEDGRSALLVPDGDPDALVRAVGRVLDDPALAASLSAGALDVATAFDWAHVAPQWRALLVDVSASRSSSRGAPTDH